MRRRERGAGTFSRLPDGRLVYRVSFGAGPEGERVRRRFYGRTQQECRDQAEEYRRALRLGLTPPTGELLREYLPRWLEGRREWLRPRTFEGYRAHIVHNIVPTVGSLEVTALERRHVVQMMARIRDRGLSARTANGAKVVLGAAMQDALRDRLVDQNVVRLVQQLPHQAEEFVPLVAREIELLRDAVRGTRDEALYAVALAFGLRQGELLGLTWADVDFDRRVLRVTHSLMHRQGDDFVLAEVKTDKSRRTVVMPEFIADVLQRQRAQQDADRARMGSWWPEHWPDLVFRAPTGRPLHGPTVTRRFQRLLADLGIERRRFHDLRHTCATYLLMSGVELKVIQEILGHATIAVTSAVYAHVLPEMQERALDHMAQLLSPVPMAQPPAQRLPKTSRPDEVRA